MMSGNISNFIKDIEAWVFESLGSSNSVVTEDGVVEDWGGMSNSYKDKIIEDLKGYVELLKSHI